MPTTKKNLRRGPKEGKKGSRSKTAHGRKNYTTKRTSKVFHRKGHYVRPGYKPFGSRKGSRSRTHKGKINYIRGGMYMTPAAAAVYGGYPHSNRANRLAATGGSPAGHLAAF